MIRKYIFGNPFETEAVVEEIKAEQGTPAFGETRAEDGFSYSYIMKDADIIYGLGEANRGINKRLPVYKQLHR